MFFTSALLIHAVVFLCGLVTGRAAPCFDDYDAKCVKVGDSFVDQMSPCNSCYCNNPGFLTCSIAQCPPGGCLYAGRVWSYNRSFQDPTTCNTCHCLPDGKVKCTDEVCPKVHCRHGKQFFYPGDKFPAKDCCNVCVCDARERTLCTTHMKCNQQR